MHRAPAPLYLPVAFVQAALPHSRTEGRFERTNGAWRLHLRAGGSGGMLPYGIYARRILARLTTQVVRAKSRKVLLGRSMSRVLASVGASGYGPRGGASVAKRQYTLMGELSFAWAPVVHGPHVSFERVIHRAASTRRDGVVVVVGERFFELAQSVVPLDPGMLRWAGRSPLRWDTYAWLTYRAATLTATTVIPWMSLCAQLGADYQRPRDVRRRLIHTVEMLRDVWPDLQVEPVPHGLRLQPFAPSVAECVTARMHRSDMNGAAGRPPVRQPSVKPVRPSRGQWPRSRGRAAHSLDSARG